MSRRTDQSMSDRADRKATATDDRGKFELPWSGRTRFWVSLVLAAHLFCVVLAPLAAVEPRSGLAMDLQSMVYPYTQAMFLQHGYRFFAPEPGPSHILKYELTTRDGKKVAGHFPDRNGHWPRLRYHRWFMLSETIFQHVSETLDQKQLDDWRQRISAEIGNLVESDPRAAEDLELQLKSELAQHAEIARIRDRLVTDVGHVLLDQHDAVSVELTMVTRLIPPPEDVARGLQLDNERYLPPELQFPLGTVNSDSDQLETIQPRESDQTDNNGEAPR